MISSGNVETQSSKFFFIQQKLWEADFYGINNESGRGEGCRHNISQFQAMGDGNGSGEDDVEDTEAPLDDRLEQCHRWGHAKSLK